VISSDRKGQLVTASDSSVLATALILGQIDNTYMTLLIMTILITPNSVDITYNDIIYNLFYLQMTLLKRVNKKT
jgi:hypothetical protein